jgi:hypothetical protein
MSWLKQGGFDKFPTTATASCGCASNCTSSDILRLCIRHATNDGDLLVSLAVVVARRAHGGRAGPCRDQQSETLRALDYARAVFRTLAPGTLSWNDASNNKAFLAGEIALTDNSTSIYGKALADKLPIAADIAHRDLADRAGRRPTRAASDLSIDRPQVHEVSERSKGLSRVHDGESAIPVPAAQLDRVHLSVAESV